MKLKIKLEKNLAGGPINPFLLKTKTRKPWNKNPGSRAGTCRHDTQA